MIYSFSRLLPAAGFAATALVASVFVQGLLPADTVFGLFLSLGLLQYPIKYSPLVLVL